MSRYRYVTLDPTGNLTCLVLDSVPAEERPAVTGRLMDRCEQVGYLEKPRQKGQRAALCMMGGEFCGNAAMACAAYLAQTAGAKAETVVPLSVSGAKGTVRCVVRPGPDGLWEGTAAMPPVLETGRTEIGGMPAALVRMEGIAHLILEDREPEKEEADRLLRMAAARLPDPCVGLLAWDGRTDFMRPLVYVRESGTMVWETGCGSGSTAVGVWLALKKGEGITETAVAQPGGVIRVQAEVRDGRTKVALITGTVRIGKEEMLEI